MSFVHTIIHCADGETVALLSDGLRWVCPVCGYAELGEAPYDMKGVASFGICPECKTEFGYDDADIGVMTLQSKWKGLRFQYLEKKQWAEDRINVVCRVLSISRKSLDLDADAWKHARK